jgi:hypothetical protein
MSEEFTPPLPRAVLDVLDRTNLCYLATTEESSPHLSLMQFSTTTVDSPDDIAIILSTKMATKKFVAITSNPKVAILIHDFNGLRNSSATPTGDHYSQGTYSVTIYGEAEVIPQNTPLRDRCLRTHLEANSKYAQFIIGDDVALLLVRPKLARICNVMDNVEHWQRSGSK